MNFEETKLKRYQTVEKLYLGYSHVDWYIYAFSVLFGFTFCFHCYFLLAYMYPVILFTVRNQARRRFIESNTEA